MDIRTLLKISRWRFWSYTFGPYLLGFIAAVNSRAELADWRLILFGIYFLFPANLLIYGINDIFDYETDRLNAKKENYELLLPRENHRTLWLIIAITNIPFIIVGVLLSWKASLAMLGFLFFSIFYSAPPIRAKAKPFLDSAFNILYVFPGIFAFVLISGEAPPVDIIAAAALWTAAMHAYSAVPDIDADKQADLKTIATVLGPYATVILCAALYLAAAIIAGKYLGFLAFPLAAGYLIMMLASLQSIRTGNLFRLYRAFPLINIFAGFLIFWQIALDKLF